MKLVGFAAVSLFGMLGIAQAQQVTLTLDKAVELALERNTAIIQARNTIDSKQSAVTAAYGSFLPSVGLSGDWQQSQSDVAFVSGIEIPGGVVSSTRKQYQAGIGADLTLFNGFANTASVSVAESDASSSQYASKRTDQTVIFQTHQFFLNVVRTYQLNKVNEDNLKRSQRQLERITESNKVGAVALADVYRQRVQVGNDELALIQAQNNYEKAKTDLLAHLAVDDDKDYVLDLSGIPTDIDTTEFQAFNAQYSNLGDLNRQALEARPDYNAATEDKNSADASITLGRSGYYPSITTSASYGYSNSELDRLMDNKTLAFSISLRYNLFNGFATQEKIEQASVARKNAEEQLRKARRDVQVDVKKALLDLEASEKQVTVTQTSVESAEMDRKIAEEKYNLGAGTLLDLLIATANYTTALSNKVNAVTGYLLAKKQTEYAVGTISK